MVLRGLRTSAALLVRNERLLAISVATVLVMAGQGIIAPVLPLYAESFGWALRPSASRCRSSPSRAWC
jgi:hypothetical protein